MPKSITAQDLPIACRSLARKDAALARIYRKLGAPPLWEREPGFATLLHIILEQQVSLASAKACLDKLLAACNGPLTAQLFLRFDDAALRGFGFSQQKTRYGRILAQAVQDGTVDFSQFTSMSDEAVHSALIALTGIGTWTATVYLLMVLRRPDVWPRGDIALQTAWQRLNRLPVRPSSDELAALSDGWAPHRAVAARLLWHFYLAGAPEI